MTCGKCGAVIDGLKFCGQCGKAAIPSKPSNAGRWIFGCFGLFVAGLAVALIVSLFSGREPPRYKAPVIVKQADPTPDIVFTTKLPEFTAAEIYRAYETNEVKADQLLKGKRVIITGKVKSVGKDILGEPYVLIEGGSVWGVQCMARGQEAALAELLPGLKVSMAGTIGGKMGNVIARTCALETAKGRE